MEDFLQEEGLPERLADMRQHATSEAIFYKRFYAWLDPLKMLRLIHHLRDQGLQQIPVAEASRELIAKMSPVPLQGAEQILKWFRERQKEFSD